MRGPRLWTSPGHGVRFYPDAITLSPEVSAAEVLAVAPPSGAFAVKDSYGTLDLAPAGFLLPIQASWIARPTAADTASGPADQTSGGPDWHLVTSPGELAAWEAAWATGADEDPPVFTRELLADPRCSVLACRRDGANRREDIVAGAIGYAADGVAGISNVFSTVHPEALLFAGLPAAAAGLWPGLPVVGYESGTALDAARHGHGVVGDAFPVAPENAGVRAEEVEPGQVHRPGGAGERRRVQRPRERVRGEHVQVPVLDEGRYLGHPVQDAGDAGPHLPGCGPAAGAAGGTGPPRRDMETTGMTAARRHDPVRTEPDES